MGSVVNIALAGHREVGWKLSKRADSRAMGLQKTASHQAVA